MTKAILLLCFFIFGAYAVGQIDLRVDSVLLSDTRVNDEKPEFVEIIGDFEFGPKASIFFTLINNSDSLIRLNTEDDVHIWLTFRINDTLVEKELNSIAQVGLLPDYLKSGESISMSFYGVDLLFIRQKLIGCHKPSILIQAIGTFKLSFSDGDIIASTTQILSLKILD
jgi:hypothetical protein